MPEYTVQDTSTGKTVTFEWSGAQPPTDADMEEVFAAAKTFKPEASARPSLVSMMGQRPMGGYTVSDTDSAPNTGLREMLQSAAHPQTIGDFMGLLIPSEMGAVVSARKAGAASKPLTETLSSVADLPKTKIIGGATARDIAVGGVKSLANKQMPVIGAIRASIEEARDLRLAREALGSGTLNKQSGPTLERALASVLDEARTADTLNTPSQVAGATKQIGKLGTKGRPSVNPEVKPNGMVATLGDKWGMTSYLPKELAAVAPESFTYGDAVETMKLAAAKGVDPATTARTITSGNATKFSVLMNLYMRATK